MTDSKVHEVKSAGPRESAAEESGGRGRGQGDLRPSSAGHMHQGRCPYLSGKNRPAVTSIIVKVVVPSFASLIVYAMSSPAEWPSMLSASWISHVASAESTPVLWSACVALEEFVMVHPGPGEHRTLSDKRGKGTGESTPQVRTRGRCMRTTHRENVQPAGDTMAAFLLRRALTLQCCWRRQGRCRPESACGRRCTRNFRRPAKGSGYRHCRHSQSRSSLRCYGSVVYTARERSARLPHRLQSSQLSLARIYGETAVPILRS